MTINRSTEKAPAEGILLPLTTAEIGEEIVASSKGWNTEKKLPFWLRRVDVAVDGEVAAAQKAEFNWQLVIVPLNATIFGMFVALALLLLGLLLGFAVSFAKTFPIVSGIALLVLLFKRS
ncbi:TPA: hypothetical protein VDB83_005127 [Burkholderia cenocepacia]|nr:hypothetical protein [Burkholderia cenocepacia]